MIMIKISIKFLVWKIFTVIKVINEKHIWCKFRAKILGYSCCKPKGLVEGKI